MLWLTSNRPYGGVKYPPNAWYHQCLRLALDLNTEMKKKKNSNKATCNYAPFFLIKDISKGQSLTVMFCRSTPSEMSGKKNKSVKTTKRHICLLNTFHIRLPNTKTWTLSNRRRSPIPKTTWVPTEFPWHFLVHLSRPREHHCGTANAMNRKKTSDICDITRWDPAREPQHAKRISQRKDRIIKD